MKNLTEEQKIKISAIYGELSGEGLTEEEIYVLYGTKKEDIIIESSVTDSSIVDSPVVEKELSLEEKINEIWEYYDSCMGIEFKTEDELLEYLGI